MTPMRLEPVALLSQVKHSTTEPLRSLLINVKMPTVVGNELILLINVKMPTIVGNELILLIDVKMPTI